MKVEVTDYKVEVTDYGVCGTDENRDYHRFTEFTHFCPKQRVDSARFKSRAGLIRSLRAAARKEHISLTAHIEKVGSSWYGYVEEW